MLRSKQLFVIVASAVFLIVFSAASMADQPKIGDRVQFEHFGDEFEGEIVDTFGSRAFRVSYEEDGRERTSVVQVDEMQLIQEKESAREWSDIDGKYTIVAELVDHSKTHVRLRKKDKRVVTVPVNKLSKADQEFLKELRAPEDAEDPDSPFAGGERELTPKESFDEARVITFGPAREDARYIPAKSGYFAERRVPVIVIAKSDDSSNLEYVAMSGDQSKIACSVTDPFDRGTNVSIFDGLTGDQIAQRGLEGNRQVLDIANDGKHMVVGVAGYQHASKPISVWTTGDEPELVFEWKFTGRDFGSSVSRAMFVDEDHLFLTKQTGQFVLWNWRTKTTVYKREGRGMGRLPAMTSDRKAFAFCDRQHLYLIETLTGKTLQRIALPKSSFSYGVSISPNNTKAALFDGRQLMICDLVAGEMLGFAAFSNSRNPSHNWCNDEYILLGNLLVDANLVAAVWQYDTKARLWPAPNHQSYVSTDSPSSHELTPLSLPHRNMSKLTAGLRYQDIVHKVEGVSVNWNSPVDVKDAKEGFKAHLAKIRMKIDQSSPVKVDISVKKGKPNILDVRSYRDGNETVRLPSAEREQKYTSYSTTATMSIKGTKVFERVYRHKPRSIRLNGKETLAEGIERLARPTASTLNSFFVSTQFTLLPGGKRVFGVSTITSEGVVE